jgi:hypothetical protein
VNKGEIQYAYALFENSGSPTFENNSVTPGNLPSWFSAPAEMTSFQPPIDRANGVSPQPQWPDANLGSDGAYDFSVNPAIASSIPGQPKDGPNPNGSWTVNSLNSSPYDMKRWGSWTTSVASDNFLYKLRPGGHLSSSDNAGYAYGPFNSETPTWHRPVDPTNDAPACVTTFIPDPARGFPVPMSVHSYNHDVYIPAFPGHPNPRYWSFALDAYYCNTTGLNTYSNSATISSEGDVPVLEYDPEFTDPQFSPPGGRGQTDRGALAFDPVENRVYLCTGGSGGRPLASFDPVAQTFEYGLSSDMGSLTTMTIDPIRRIAICNKAPQDGSGIIVFDINRNSGNLGDAFNYIIPGGPSSAGEVGWPDGSQTDAYERDPINDVIIGWGGSTNPLWQLAPPADYRTGPSVDDPLNPSASWQWLEIPGSQGWHPEPVIYGTNGPGGLYGNFRYIASLHAFAAIMTAANGIWIYKAPTNGYF